MPKKHLGSYLLPFFLILILLGSAFYIIQNNLNLDDLRRVFQGPEVAKDEKVTLVYQEGNNEHKLWNQENWIGLEDEAYLQVGDTLKTAKNGVLVLRFFEASEIRMAANSTLKLIRLDKDDDTGNHLEVELISGKVWRRGPAANTEDADFIIKTNHQVVQMNQTAVVDISTNPESSRIIAGACTVNIAQEINGARKPISRIDLQAGQALVLDDLVIDDLKTGDKNVAGALDDNYLQSEWYLWNMSKEETLGLLLPETDLPEEVPSTADLVKLEPGLVVVNRPLPDTVTGAKILVEGTYDSEKISKIWVNDAAVILGLNGDWEAALTLSEQKNTILITALEIGSEETKEAASFTVKVDSSGPVLGSITKPEVDANDNGVLIGDSLELVGEISGDAQKVCISHNDSDPPYCLKQFTAGSGTYRYLGSVSYGNVVKGKNKYTIYAYDDLNNISSKTIYLFKDEAKPESRLADSGTTTEVTATVSDLSKPVIIEPDPALTHELSEAELTIKGTVDTRSYSLIINDKKAVYQRGAGDFEVTFTLSEGENNIKIQSVDSQGNKSKTALLKVIYLPKPPEPEVAETKIE